MQSWQKVSRKTTKGALISGFIGNSHPSFV
jgi:hypothetical protein